MGGTVCFLFVCLFVCCQARLVVQCLEHEIKAPRKPLFPCELLQDLQHMPISLLHALEAEPLEELLNDMATP